MLFDSCFPHIVNLACKAALAAITDLTYVNETIEGYLDYDPSFQLHEGLHCQLLALL